MANGLSATGAAGLVDPLANSGGSYRKERLDLERAGVAPPPSHEVVPLMKVAVRGQPRRVGGDLSIQ